MSILELEKVEAPPELATKLYTVAEFLNLEVADEDEEDYELIGGRIVAKSQGSTSATHGEIASLISYYLQAYAGVGAGEKRLGKVYDAVSTNLGQPTGLSMPKPDVCFVLKGRTPDKFAGPIPVAPDLVVEVNSPSDTEERRYEKLVAYQEAGVSLIWTIYVLEKYVMVYRKGEPYPQLFNLKDELDGGEVLPGFKLAVSKLFE